jgi:hypothetical protein
MGLMQAFNSIITTRVICKKLVRRMKKVLMLPITNMGMEIYGDKEPNFNFESNETSSKEDFNLFMSCHEILPRCASHIK